MIRSPISWLRWLALLFLGLFTVAAFSQNPTPATLRARSQKLKNDGNFREAYDGFRRLCLDPNAGTAAVSQDLTNAVECLNNLGRIQEFDDLVEKTIAAHQQNWRLLQTAAQQYLHVEHQGFRIAGKFERGPHRGGGEHVNAMERDRVRALQLMRDAMPLAQRDDRKAEVSQFWMSLADMLLSNRGYSEAWRLQYLTDLATLPDYDEGYAYYREYNGAPVDAEGQPIYHTVPTSWDAAETDGQRWRWALAQAVENSPDQLNSVRIHLAQFFEQQFGVESLQHGHGGRLFAPQSDDDTKKDDSGTYALHTLKENETIAKLASGIKRFELPDEFNPISIYQQIIAEPRTGDGRASHCKASPRFLRTAGSIPRPPSIGGKSIRQFGAGQNRWKQERLDQIVGNWGQFDATTSQPAGEGATVGFRFRNGKKVKFDARAIKVDLLLDDLKAYLKSDPGNRIDWNKINLGNIGHRLVNENETKYLGEQVATWDLALDPRPNHFDRRITVTTPLQKAGAYLVTATVEGGNTSKIILWVADTAIVQKNLNGKTLYFVADAASGAAARRSQRRILRLAAAAPGQQPLPGRHDELLRADRPGRPAHSRPARSQARISVARHRPRQSHRRLAFLGFTGVWTGQYHDAEYNQVKIFTITDRPVYRPEPKSAVQALGRSAPSTTTTKATSPAQTLPIVILNPKGEKIYQPDAQGRRIRRPRRRIRTAHRRHARPIHDQPRRRPQHPALRHQRQHVPRRGIQEARVRSHDQSPDRARHARRKNHRQDRGQVLLRLARHQGHGQIQNPPHQPHRRLVSRRAAGTGAMAPATGGSPTTTPGIPASATGSAAGGRIPSGGRASTARRPKSSPKSSARSARTARSTSRSTRSSPKSCTATPTTNTRSPPKSATNRAARSSAKATSSSPASRSKSSPGSIAATTASAMPSKPTSRPKRSTTSPSQGKGVLKLLKITYDPNKQPIETPVADLEHRHRRRRPGQPADHSLRPGPIPPLLHAHRRQGHAIEGGYIFTITGQGFDGSEFRFNNVELVPDKAEYAPGDTVKLQLNTNRADSTVLLFVRPTNGVYLEPKLLRLKGKSTIEDIAVVKKDMPNFFVEAVTIAGGQRPQRNQGNRRSARKARAQRRSAALGKEYKPGEKGKVKIHLTDADGSRLRRLHRPHHVRQIRRVHLRRLQRRRHQGVLLEMAAPPSPAASRQPRQMVAQPHAPQQARHGLHRPLRCHRRG